MRNKKEPPKLCVAVSARGMEAQNITVRLQAEACNVC